MTAPSTSSRLLNKLFFEAFALLAMTAILAPDSLFAAPQKRKTRGGVRSEYRLNISWRDVVTAFGEKDLISNRGRTEFEYKALFNPSIQAVASGRLTFETAYSQNSNLYSDTIRSNSFYEATLRDTYLSVKQGGASLRAGYQTVVWGEAFGNFYTDILNPKDFRELWLNELSEHEISIPMINAQFAGDSYGFQLIYLPRPSFNRNPNPDSPYAPKWTDPSLIPPGTTLGIQQEKAPDWFRVNEWAGRFNFQLGSADFSIFAFGGLDRNPFYELDSAAPGSLILGERHSRIRAQGITASADLDGSILRLESVLVSDRQINELIPSGIGKVTTDNLISVVGYDFPRSSSTSIGVQATADLLLESSRSYWFREANRYTLATRFWWEFSGEHSLEVLGSAMLPTLGALLQPRFTHPLSRNLEFRWGGDLFFGKEGSEYNRFSESSRVWIRLTGYFNGRS